MRPSPALLAACLLAVPHVAAAQAVGPQFQVNTYTTGFQNTEPLGRNVAIDANGDFIVTWHGRPDAAVSNAIAARRYDADGNPKGASIVVNAYTTGNAFFPSVASDDTGAFVVVWDHRNGRDGSNGGIFARRYDAAGLALGPEFQVNSYTTGNQIYPTIAMNSAGSFVIAWDSKQDGSYSGIFAKRYDASGVPQGGEFQVNTYTTGYQTTASAAMDAAGNFAVAWQNVGSVPSSISVQRFAANGVRQGGEFDASSSTTDQRLPAVAMAPDGAFLVAWDDNNRDGSARGIFARRFDALGVAQGGDFQVNTYTTGVQFGPRASTDVDGGFVVTWTDAAGRDGSSNGIVAQRLDNAGAPRGAEFVVNSYTTGRQNYPTFAVNASGQAVAVWQDIDGQDGSNAGVFGQRFSFAPDTTAPAVTVTSPNGGEILYTSVAFPITWTASDAVGIDHVDVEYSTDAGQHWSAVPGCTSLPAAALLCSWTAPGPVTTKGRIRVTATDAANNAGSDISNANYEVSAGSPSVTLTIPSAAGLAWQAGTTKAVKWSHNLGKNQAFTLELNRDYPSGPWELVTTNALSNAKLTGTYNWLVTSGPTNGATARLRLSWTADASIEDLSDNGFAITSRVKVTQPNGPVSWPSGSTKVIKWTHNLGSAAQFAIGLDRDGDSVCEETIARGVPASTAKAGTYSWHVCGTSPARVCVASLLSPIDGDVSDAAFNITGVPVSCGVP